jgi:hypothetical protein
MQRPHLSAACWPRPAAAVQRVFAACGSPPDRPAPVQTTTPPPGLRIAAEQPADPARRSIRSLTPFCARRHGQHRRQRAGAPRSVRQQRRGVPLRHWRHGGADHAARSVSIAFRLVGVRPSHFQRLRQTLGRHRLGGLQLLREQRHAPFLDQPAQFVQTTAPAARWLRYSRQYGSTCSMRCWSLGRGSCRRRSARRRMAFR